MIIFHQNLLIILQWQEELDKSKKLIEIDIMINNLEPQVVK